MNAIQNPKKIINDAVYGFINIPSQEIYNLIEHPYMQRLRRIKQLGLTNLVYPGAEHTRFAHSLGAMHLMMQALHTIKEKGEKISDEEYTASLSAILLHDVGHSPFSHCLEGFFFSQSHEQITLALMKKIGLSPLTIQIFSNEYSKHFFHQLVSSQVDCDRLDYLTRDSFFTGVVEGSIGTKRIINMFSLKDDNLVIDEKGILSIEKFILSRRMMYWQVYMHKAVVAADIQLRNILMRARQIAHEDNNIINHISPYLAYFILNGACKTDNEQALEYFVQIDDSDIISALKVWQSAKDTTLSLLCTDLLSRRLGKIKIQKEPFSQQEITQAINQLAQEQSKCFSKEEIKNYFVQSNELKNKAYDFSDEEIDILFKDGSTKELCYASDQLDKAFLSKINKKYYLYSHQIK